MLELYSHVICNEISFNSYDDIDLDSTDDIKEIYSTIIINDIKYDIKLNVLCEVVCDKMIIYCDNIEPLDYQLPSDMIPYKENIDCTTLIIKAKTIKSKQLNILIRKNKIDKILGI